MDLSRTIAAIMMMFAMNAMTMTTMKIINHEIFNASMDMDAADVDLFTSKSTGETNIRLGSMGVRVRIRSRGASVNCTFIVCDMLLVFVTIENANVLVSRN